jgi:hypothetical protein
VPGDLASVQHQPSPGVSSAVSEEVVTNAGAALGHDFLPPGVTRGPDGRWQQAVSGDSNAAMWRPTPSTEA